jgi:probable F420-dependent oxidoreductase
VKFGFIPIEGGHFYREFMEEVELGESLGFDSVWLEEHHGVSDHYWSSPLMGLAGIATRTERLALGTNILILPLYQPVKVAEDGAMLQIMSGGRFILGVALGYKPDEFKLLQTKLEGRGARFEEQVQLIRQLWTQESVQFQGEHYQIEGLKIEPRPQTPPPIWIGGWGPLSLKRAAVLGDAWTPGPTADLQKLLDGQETYRGHLEQLGVDPASRVTPLTRELVIAESNEEARRMAEEHLLISYRDEYGGGTWKHPLIGAEDASPVDQLDALGRDRFLVGDPDTVASQIKRFHETFGVDHLIFRMFFPGLPHEFIMRELKLVAEEILPRFR